MSALLSKGLRTLTRNIRMPEWLIPKGDTLVDVRGQTLEGRGSFCALHDKRGWASAVGLEGLEYLEALEKLEELERLEPLEALEKLESLEKQARNEKNVAHLRKKPAYSWRFKRKDVYLQ